MFVIRREKNLLIKRLSYRRRRHHHHHHRHLHLYVSFAYLQNSFKKKIINNFFKICYSKGRKLVDKKIKLPASSSPSSSSSSSLSSSASRRLLRLSADKIRSKEKFFLGKKMNRINLWNLSIINWYLSLKVNKTD